MGYADGTYAEMGEHSASTIVARTSGESVAGMEGHAVECPLPGPRGKQQKCYCTLLLAQGTV